MFVGIGVPVRNVSGRKEAASSTEDEKTSSLGSNKIFNISPRSQDPETGDGENIYIYIKE